MKKLLSILMIAGAMMFSFSSCEESSPELDVWYAMKERVKAQLKNPDSFEEKDYSITPLGNDEYIITMKFNGENSFGGTVLTEATAKAKWTKESTKIYDFEIQ